MQDRSKDESIVPAAGDFAEPPALISLSEARGLRKEAIRRQLDALENGNIASFGKDALDLTAETLSALSAALQELEPGTDVSRFDGFARALAEFEVGPDDGRRQRTLGEKIRQRDAPFEDFLRRLDRLVQIVPNPGSDKSAGWDRLGEAYAVAISAVSDLGDCIAAAKARLAKANADLISGQNANARVCPEDLNADAQSWLQSLKSTRDDIERCAHRLRSARNRAVEFLAVVEAVGTARKDLRRRSELLRTSGILPWEARLTEIIEIPLRDRRDKTPVDLSEVDAANAALADALTEVVTGAQALTEAQRAALSHPLPEWRR